MDLSNFDIAHYAGHKALDELRKAYEIYTYPVGRVLSDNGIQVTSMDFKENHDIEIHASRISIRELDINIVDPVNAFHWGGYLRSLRIKEAEMCINSAIFFQVMMETSINDALGNSAKGSFSEKWKSFLIDNGASEEESGYFESYFRNIYKKIRNPTVHAKQRIGGIDASSLRFSHVHKNIRLGWFSFVFLLRRLHDCEIPYQENWAQMAEKIHGVPASIDESEFCDISSFAGSLTKKHLDHFNNMNGS